MVRSAKLTGPYARQKRCCAPSLILVHVLNQYVSFVVSSCVVVAGSGNSVYVYGCPLCNVVFVCGIVVSLVGARCSSKVV